MTQPKLWSERDFDECCFAVSGISHETMVCAAPCRGSYCAEHRLVPVEDYPVARRVKPRARVRRNGELMSRRPSHEVVQSVVETTATARRLTASDLTGTKRGPRYTAARIECWRKIIDQTKCSMNGLATVWGCDRQLIRRMLAREVFPNNNAAPGKVLFNHSRSQLDSVAC